MEFAEERQFQTVDNPAGKERELLLRTLGFVFALGEVPVAYRP